MKVHGFLSDMLVLLLTSKNSTELKQPVKRRSLLFIKHTCRFNEILHSVEVNDLMISVSSCGLQAMYLGFGGSQIV